MAQDEPKPDDIVQTVDGFTFVLDKNIAGSAGDITIHATARGIEIYSGSNRGGNYGCSK
jgi:hypothetical protein